MSSNLNRRLPILLIAALLALDVAAYLFEKIACNHATAAGGTFFVALVHQPLLWASILLSPLQLWTWTKILSRADLSLAYPISGLNYPLTVLAAVILLGETLSWQIWLGTALITLGIIVIGPAQKELPAPACPAGPTE
jgi:drug/metabolite transporter (DMT)-like permease